MSKSEARKQAMALDKALSPYERELQQAYNESLKNIRAQIAVLYERSGGNFADAAKYNRLTSLEKAIGEEIQALTGKTAKTLRNGIIGQYEEARLREMFVIEKGIGAVADFSMLNQAQISEAIRNPYDRIGFIQRDKDNAAQLVKQMRQEITQGLIQGKSFQDTARIVKNRMEIGGSNALRIVRTESKRARGKAKQDTQEEAQSLGVDIQKQWVSTTDDRTRDEHGMADSQTVALDEAFDVGGEMLMYPGDPAGSAGNVINCRCTTISVVGGFRPSTRRIRGEGLVEFKSYAQWKEGRDSV